MNDERKPLDYLQTDAARAARRQTRQTTEAEKVANRHRLMVFTVRLSGTAFGWELRHFGSIVHHRSSENYSSEQLARQAGEAALAAMPVDAIS